VKLVSKKSALVFFCLGLLCPSLVSGHPLKLSASLIDYDPKAKTIRVECKVFVDDFELSVERSVLKGVDTSKIKKEDKPGIIEDYFKRFYTITLNGKVLPLKLKVATPLPQHNVLVIEFVEIPLVLKEGDKFEIRNAMFFQDFGPLQTNRILVRIPPFGIDEGHVATMYGSKFSYNLGDTK